MKILIAGDFVSQHRVTDLFAQKKYAEVLSEVKPIVEQSDFSIVNLEAPVIYDKPTPITKTGPNLYCSENAVEALIWAGFDCVTLANNHFYDQGEQGVEGTFKACEKNAMDYVGAGRNLIEAGSVLYREVLGQVLAIVNCCEQEWSIASDKHGGSNPLNPIKQYYAIQEAKKKADYVLVIVHGGIEMYQYPTPRMQETYRFFIDAGADAVVNHHQHCFSGYEVYNGKPIFYGLGNFCFDNNKEDEDKWSQGYMAQLQLGHSGVDFNIVPFIQCGADAVVHLLNEIEQRNFSCIMKELNDSINNADKLHNRFNQKVLQVTEQRFLALEPFRNKLLYLLQKKHLFPRLVRKEGKKSMFMRMRCESNREILLSVLQNYFNL